MRAFIYSIGYISSLCTIVGIYFKLVHFPMATVLMLGGATVFTIIFLPLLLTYKSREGKLRSSHLLVSSLAALALTTLWFEVMQIAGSGILHLLTVLLVVFGLLPHLFFVQYRKA